MPCAAALRTVATPSPATPTTPSTTPPATKGRTPTVHTTPPHIPAHTMQVTVVSGVLRRFYRVRGFFRVFVESVVFLGVFMESSVFLGVFRESLVFLGVFMESVTMTVHTTTPHRPAHTGLHPMRLSATGQGVDVGTSRKTCRSTLSPQEYLRNTAQHVQNVFCCPQSVR